MWTDQTFAENDALDRQRLYLVLAGLAGSALGVDPGAVNYDQQSISNPAGQHNVFSVTTGTAPQGQAALTANIMGYQITLPVLVLIGVGAFLVLRK